MARNIKTFRKHFDYRQCDDFAAYLNYMARRGWHFKEFRSGLVFEKGEPEEAVYAVEIFTDGTAHDMRPSYKAENFGEYCEAAGWKFLDQRVKWCVLKRIREEAVPIFTDEERFENVKSVTYSGPGKLLWVELVILAVMAWMIWYSPKVYFFTLTQILWSVYWPLVLLRDVYQIIDHRRWCRDCEARLERGEPLYFRKERKRVLGWGIVTAPLLISIAYFLNFDIFAIKLAWIITAVFIGLLFLLTYLPGRRRMDAESSKLITALYWFIAIFYLFVMLVVASYQDMEKPEPEPPVSISVFRPGEEAADVELSRDTTPFGSKLSCTLNLEEDRIRYYVYLSEYDWVLDAVWNQELRDEDNQIKEDCTDTWYAEEAFRNADGDYLVRYTDRILILRPSSEPLTQEQIDTVIAALKEG